MARGQSRALHRLSPLLRRSNMHVPRVVDADGHCQEPEEGLAQWMPKELASRAPRRITDNLGQPRVLIEGRVWGKSEGLGPSVSGPFAPHIVGSRPGMRDTRQRLVDMDDRRVAGDGRLRLRGPGPPGPRTG